VQEYVLGFFVATLYCHQKSGNFSPTTKQLIIKYYIFKHLLLIQLLLVDKRTLYSYKSAAIKSNLDHSKQQHHLTALMLLDHKKPQRGSQFVS
jgi:hypothetical protein